MQENGDVSLETEFVPRKCDIITISGRAEKCDLAKAALLVRKPHFITNRIRAGGWKTVFRTVFS